MKSIIFIAPPAGGKGTQSKLLCEKHNIPHISTGNLLREFSKQNTPIGEHVRELINNGKLIDDDIMLELLERRLLNVDCTSGYILDGFPRSIEQAIKYDQLLIKINKELGHVILINVDLELLKSRVAARALCPNCNAIYNLDYEGAKPVNANICNICNTELIKRKDDLIDVFMDRYNFYESSSKPLIDYYKSKNKLYAVDGNISLYYTNEQIEKIISEED